MLERRRDLHIEPEKKRATGKFTFAGLGENEEDLTELEAWSGTPLAGPAPPTRPVHEDKGGG